MNFQKVEESALRNLKELIISNQRNFSKITLLLHHTILKSLHPELRPEDYQLVEEKDPHCLS